MKAWLLDDFNGIQGLRVAEIPDPTPQAGEVVLAVHYAGLNPADRYLAERQYPARPALPHILGRDGIGTVVAVGPGVSGLKPGDQRALLRGDAGGNKPGTFAERVVVPAESLVELPAGWTEEQGAGATLVYLTAYQALTMWHDLPEAAVVLVSGASGGVGSATVQLAAAMGHTVVALSRSPEKSQRLLELGARATFDPSDPQWRRAALSSLDKRRVDIAVDNIGGKLLPEMIETLADLGRVSLVGRLAGPVPNFNTATLFFRRLRLGGVAVGAYTNAESRTAWQRVTELMSHAEARPLVDSVFPFEELPQAFEQLSRGPMGKVLLQVYRPKK
jgi:NADPH:quinone reductase